MHIMEGYLPIGQALVWSAVTAPFLILGLRTLERVVTEKPGLKLLLGAVGGFAFVLSALKIPSVTGSSSHPTGVGLGAILFGPSIMVAISCIILLFQALLLAHGGISTLGANLCSMGVVGPWVAWGTFRLAGRLHIPGSIGALLAAALGDLSTYLMTAFQLALAYPDPSHGILGAWLKFAGIFAPTQLPLAMTEGLLTALVLKLISQSPELDELRDWV